MPRQGDVECQLALQFNLEDLVVILAPPMRSCLVSRAGKVAGSTHMDGLRVYQDFAM